MDISTEVLYKADIPDMPLLYFLVTRVGIFVWTKQDGWTTSDWDLDLIELTDWVQILQGGKLLKSSRLQFLLESGLELMKSYDQRTSFFIE